LGSLIDSEGKTTRPEPRIALVTGANRGIGYEIARGLVERSFLVLVGCRTVELGEAAARNLKSEDRRTQFLPIDITDDASVANAAASIAGEYGKLDVLVNNAAVKLEWHPSPPSQLSLAIVRETYETNVFGTIRVIQAMLPLLYRAESPRIVNMSSGLGSLTLATTEGTKYRERPLLSYNTAKAALNSVTVQFANELRSTHIKINAVDPGATNTPMTRGLGERTPERAAMVAIQMATLADDGPTGCFFDENGELPW
jgi:NAD(P)-dependent dehydrogenase (short-subunit alcohol dehydrogenase family)